MSTPLATWLASNPLPDPFSTDNKEERGRVLVVGGSTQVPGAAWLAARAALHAGAGKLHVGTAASTAITLAARLPEAMVTPLRADARGEIAFLNRTIRAAAANADGLLVGPGMADRTPTRRLVANLVSLARSPCILDAGAIGGWKSLADACMIGLVTPHTGEMAAAAGLTREEVEASPLRIAREFARAARCVVVMKGVPTYVVDEEGDVLEYHVAAPGLGTSGSGDVLAGLIAGLVARGAAPRTAAAWAVWLHGESGRALGDRIGPVGYLAREISPEVPRLMRAPFGATPTFLGTPGASTA